MTTTEGTALLPREPGVGAPALSRRTKQIIVAASLLTGFLSTLDLTSESWSHTH